MTPSRNRLLIALIVASIVAWGMFHALGAYFNYENTHLGRPLVVLACVGGFLGLWLILLARRANRLAHRAPEDRAPEGRAHRD